MMKNLYRGEVLYLIASPLDHVEAYRYFEDGGLAVVAVSYTHLTLTTT